ncbi:hypothetical protein AC1031_007745 [Aphanomyces cochlioides]|nr:hypothetical protein AC1031_007745 [Aphanomyces cochlioides]
MRSRMPFAPRMTASRSRLVPSTCSAIAMSVENLFKTATNLTDYCNAIAPTTPPAAKTTQPSTTAATTGGTTTAAPTPTPTKSGASTVFGALVVGFVASCMLLLA